MTREHLDPTALLDAIRRLSGTSSEELLALAAENAPAMTSRSATPEDAEVCRLAMIAGASVHDYLVSTLWRGRALARFIALDWHAGAAGILMTDVFRLLEMANGVGYENLTVDLLKPAPLAVELLAELGPFADGPSLEYGFGPTPQLIRRFIEEKTGFLLMLQEDYPGARARYQAAQSIAVDHRGVVKVPLGLALVDYLEDTSCGRDGRAAAQRTEELIDRCDPDRMEFVRVARINVDRMRAGRRDLLTYEIL